MEIMSIRLVTVIISLFISVSSYGESQTVRSWSTALSLNLYGSFEVLGGFGASIGYFLKPNLIVQLEFAGGGRLIDDFSYRSTSIYIKQLPFNSFPAYYRLGLNYNQVEDSDKGELFTSPKTWSYKAKIFSLTLNTGIQKQWKNWLLGIDILGITIPFSHDYSQQIYMSTEAETNLRENQDGIEKISINLCWLYLGYSF